MRNRFLIALAAGVLGAISIFGFVQATPGDGVSSTLFAVGRFDDIDAKTLTDIDPTARTDYWQARIKTKGRIGPVHPREPDRAGRDVWLALPSRTEFGRRQDRGTDCVPCRRPDAAQATSSKRVMASSTMAATPTSSATKARSSRSCT